jgi:hypothetical protein
VQFALEQTGKCVARGILKKHLRLPSAKSMEPFIVSVVDEEGQLMNSRKLHFGKHEKALAELCEKYDGEPEASRCFKGSKLE